MAIARINHVAVQQAVADLFKATLPEESSAAIFTRVHYGQDEPTNLDIWARIIAIDVREAERTIGGDQPDDADVSIAVGCYASGASTMANNGAVRRVVSAVAKLLTHREKTMNGHVLQTFGYTAQDDPTPSTNRRLRAVHMIVAGTVNRQSGDTI